jgi:hypothetical protein
MQDEGWVLFCKWRYQRVEQARGLIRNTGVRDRKKSVPGASLRRHLLTRIKKKRWRDARDIDIKRGVRKLQTVSGACDVLCWIHFPRTRKHDPKVKSDKFKEMGRQKGEKKDTWWWYVHHPHVHMNARALRSSSQRPTKVGLQSSNFTTDSCHCRWIVGL